MFVVVICFCRHCRCLSFFVFRHRSHLSLFVVRKSHYCCPLSQCYCCPIAANATTNSTPAAHQQNTGRKTGNTLAGSTPANHTVTCSTPADHQQKTSNTPAADWQHTGRIPAAHRQNTNRTPAAHRQHTGSTPDCCCLLPL